MSEDVNDIGKVVDPTSYKRPLKVRIRPSGRLPWKMS
jgi:hypothetical protein